MKIALIQQAASVDREVNIERALASAERAARDGARLICFAELAFEPFYPQYRGNDAVLEKAVTIPGPITDRFCQFAREHQVAIVLNLFERAGDKTYDSSPVIDCDGSILGVTRMVHITDYPCFYEQDYYAPGNQGAPVYTTQVGRIGVAICYDRHFPEYMRALAVAGAEVVVVPQAGTLGEWPEGLYEAEMQVAAFQNGYFTALCNRVGQEDQMVFAGESFICDPSGCVVARAGAGTDEILIHELDLDEVKKSHARQLFLQHRRPDLYADWLGRDRSNSHSTSQSDSP